MDNPPNLKQSDANSGKVGSGAHDDIGDQHFMNDTDLANNDKPINFGSDIQVENSKFNKAVAVVQSANRVAKGGVSPS